jgi:hypothetical protein
VILPMIFVILTKKLHKSTLFIGETVIHIKHTRFQEKGGSYAPGLVEETLLHRVSQPVCRGKSSLVCWQ